MTLQYSDLFKEDLRKWATSSKSLKDNASYWNFNLNGIEKGYTTERYYTGRL